MQASVTSSDLTHSYGTRSAVKREAPSAIEQHDAKKNKNSKTNAKIHAPKEILLSKFTDKYLSLVSESGNYQERINSLLSQMEHFPIEKSGDLNYWQIFLELNETDEKKKPAFLDLYITEDQFISTFATEESIHPDKITGHRYYQLNLTEYQKDQDPFLQIRFAKEERVPAEIQVINKFVKLPGKALRDLSIKICKAIRPNIIYLRDEAKYFLHVQDLKNPYPFNMKCYLPIVRDCGEAWYSGEEAYGGAGFYPSTVKGLKGTDQVTFTQDAQYFYAAVEKVRNTSIEALKMLFFSENENLATLHRLESVYSPPQKDKDEDLTLTVHQLGKQIFQKLITNNEPDVIKDFYDFYKTCLQPTNHTKLRNKPIERRTYNMALDTLQSHVIFERSLESPENALSFKKFQSSPHNSFDEMVGNIKIATHWMHICKSKVNGETKAS